jgi:hypothetical protein
MISTARWISASQPADSRLGDQRQRAPVEHLTGRRELCAAPLQLEDLERQLRLDLLHGVAHRRLALVKALRGLRVAAGVDDGDQGAPLVERDLGGCGHLSKNWIAST